MAKKKIVLSTKPLETVVIGKKKTNRFGWFFMAIIFLAFGLLIYFLPELYDLYDNYKKGTVPNNDTVKNETIPPVKEEVPDEPEKEEKKYKEFNVDKSYEYENILFQNIQMKKKTITFKAVNQSTEDINLNNKNIFIELLNSEGQRIDAYAIKGSLEKELDYSFPADNDVKYFDIKIIEKSDYTYINLDIDEEGYSTLTCQNKNEEYIYTFYNEKLSSVNYKADYQKNIENYNAYYDKYNMLVARYVNNNDINVSLSTSSLGLSFKMDVYYNSNIIINENEFFFDKTAKPHEVNFIMKANLFECR